MSYAKNKKAYHDYHILDEYEAGIQLNGDEVKSVKQSQANLKGGFIDVQEGQAYLNEVHISRYKHSARPETNPTRARRLLLHAKQIAKIAAAIGEKGVTCIPLELYPKGGLIKLKIGLCRGKKLHDKRADLKKKQQTREIERQMKRY